MDAFQIAAFPKRTKRCRHTNLASLQGGLNLNWLICNAKNVVYYFLLNFLFFSAELHPAPDFGRHTLIKPRIYHGREKRQISTTREEVSYLNFTQMQLFQLLVWVVCSTSCFIVTLVSYNVIDKKVATKELMFVSDKLYWMWKSCAASPSYFEGSWGHFFSLDVMLFRLLVRFISIYRDVMLINSRTILFSQRLIYSMYD